MAKSMHFTSLILLHPLLRLLRSPRLVCSCDSVLSCIHGALAPYDHVECIISNLMTLFHFVFLLELHHLSSVSAIDKIIEESKRKEEQRHKEAEEDAKKRAELSGPHEDIGVEEL